MAARKSVFAELEEQRCLIEQQQVTIGRQHRRIELQLRLMSEMQAQIDGIRSTLQRVVPLRAGGLEQPPWNRPPRSGSSQTQPRFPAAIDRAPSRAQGSSAWEEMCKGGVTELARPQDRSEANASKRR